MVFVAKETCLRCCQILPGPKPKVVERVSITPLFGKRPYSPSQSNFSGRDCSNTFFFSAKGIIIGASWEGTMLDVADTEIRLDILATLSIVPFNVYLLPPTTCYLFLSLIGDDSTSWYSVQKCMFVYNLIWNCVMVIFNSNLLE